MSEETPRGNLIITFTRVVRQATGLHEQFSCQIATALVDELGRQHGCDNLYIPAPPKSEKRDAVLADFDGTNIAAVCRKHGISRSTFYRYVQDTRA